MGQARVPGFSHFLLPFCIFFGFIAWEVQPQVLEKGESKAEVGRILFLVHQGEHDRALKLYKNLFQSRKQHDYELLHQIGLKILSEGCYKNDPESQLLSLFGASVSAHEDAYDILEHSLKNRFPEIQLVALNALAHFQTDRADQALLRALGSSFLQVRYEAVHLLCKKKHPQAVNQAESLLYKSPKALWPLYPSLFASSTDPHSTNILSKLLSHFSEKVRLAAILSISKYERDDFLQKIRQRACHCSFALQEASAYTLGCLKDTEGVPLLKQLTTSQYSTVALAAHLALFHLGDENAIKTLEKCAQKGDVFAIASLGTISDQSHVLLQLLESSEPQVHFNALIALIEQNHPRGLELIDEILLRGKKDLAFTPYHSPGKSIKAWKVISSASQLLKNDPFAYQEHLNLKISLLKKVSAQEESHFIDLAHQIFTKQQNDLIPATIELLEELNTKKAIECLKQHQQQLGAPLVRQYCNLALYRLNEPGPYGEQLRQWVNVQSKTEFIRLRPINPWEYGESCFTLSPEETSQLLIEAFEAFATQQDSFGIETLIEAIATGHAKNKYALAGLLLRATQ